MNIYGFSLIKNGVEFDYPFMESFASMLPIVNNLYINVGRSKDKTEEKCREINKDKIKIFTKDWDEDRTDRGHILSDNTNYILKILKNSIENNELNSAWGLYLQADEVIHQEELNLIKCDIQKANDEGFDCVCFRYVHFWQSHNSIAINKKWYPNEIRAIKLKTDIESYGDAQSFRRYQRKYYSNAHIYHYGHVRDQKAYTKKVDRMIMYYCSPVEWKKFSRKWKRKDRNTETLSFLVDHPKIMRSRIDRIGGLYEYPEAKKVNIIGNRNDFSSEIIQKINAKKINFYSNLKKVPLDEWSNSIFMNPGLIQKILFPSKVPDKMRSKLAKKWTNDFILALKLSEKGIGLKSLT